MMQRLSLLIVDPTLFYFFTRVDRWLEHKKHFWGWASGVLFLQQGGGKQGSRTPHVRDERRILRGYTKKIIHFYQ
jgi:hypothetical protein